MIFTEISTFDELYKFSLVLKNDSITVHIGYNSNHFNHFKLIDINRFIDNSSLFCKMFPKNTNELIVMIDQYLFLDSNMKVYIDEYFIYSNLTEIDVTYFLEHYLVKNHNEFKILSHSFYSIVLNPSLKTMNKNRITKIQNSKDLKREYETLLTLETLPYNSLYPNMHPILKKINDEEFKTLKLINDNIDIRDVEGKNFDHDHLTLGNNPDEEFLYLETDFINGRTLGDFLHRRLTYDEFLFIFNKIMLMIDTLMILKINHGIIHNDLKFANIMLNDNNDLVLIDIQNLLPGDISPFLKMKNYIYDNMLKFLNELISLQSMKDHLPTIDLYFNDEEINVLKNESSEHKLNNLTSKIKTKIAFL